MSLVLNMVGGGGGGLSATDALLRVQAPAGSTVTITKGTTTKTDQGHENADDHTVYDYYFIIHQSQFDSVYPWTVTATLGSLASFDTVIIDTPDEYDMALTPLVGIDYQAVEYIQGSGTQGLITPGNLIDSYSSSDKYVITLDYYLTASASGTKYLFGVENASAPKFFGVLISSSNNDTTFHGSVENSTITKSAVNTRYEVNFIAQNGAFSVTRNGSVLKGNTSSGTSYPVGVPCGIGTCYWHGAPLTSQYLPSARLYGFKFKINDVAVYDMYPCYRRADSVAGMYDRVTGAFSVNVGTGTFAVGADIK